ncbi:serine/threonine protein kinase HipA of HipAB toxin-antitoxin module [Nitrobacteraceae bacterium AZCC 2146]
MIQEVSSDPLADTIEYLMRDLLNLATGNPDNHGRNTALRKFVDGSIRLAPLFDYAPKKLAAAGIPRSTKWKCMKAQGLDLRPDWSEVCETVAGKLTAADLKSALAGKEELLRALPDIARRHGVPEQVVAIAITANNQLADDVAQLRPASANK